MNEDDNADYAKMLLLDEDLEEKIKKVQSRISDSEDELGRYIISIAKLFNHWMNISDFDIYLSEDFQCCYVDGVLTINKVVKKTYEEILSADVRTSSVRHIKLNFVNTGLLIDFILEIKLAITREVDKQVVKASKIESLTDKFAAYFGGQDE